MHNALTPDPTGRQLASDAEGASLRRNGSCAVSARSQGSSCVINARNADRAAHPGHFKSTQQPRWAIGTSAVTSEELEELSNKARRQLDIDMSLRVPLPPRRPSRERLLSDKRGLSVDPDPFRVSRSRPPAHALAVRPLLAPQGSAPDLRRVYGASALDDDILAIRNASYARYRASGDKTLPETPVESPLSLSFQRDNRSVASVDLDDMSPNLTTPDVPPRPESDPTSGEKAKQRPPASAARYSFIQLDSPSVTRHDSSRTIGSLLSPRTASWRCEDERDYFALTAPPPSVRNSLSSYTIASTDSDFPVPPSPLSSTNTEVSFNAPAIKVDL